MMPRRLLYVVRRLLGDKSGAALIEFAFALPILLALYGASVEISDGIACNRKVAVTTRTVADLIAQNTTGSTSASEVDATLSAATQVLSPYSVANAVVTITEVTTDNNYNSTVVWSRSINGLAPAANTVVILPVLMRIPGTYFLLSTVKYNYLSQFNFGFIGPKALSGSLYMLPRNTNSIVCADC